MKSPGTKDYRKIKSKRALFYKIKLSFMKEIQIELKIRRNKTYLT